MFASPIPIDINDTVIPLDGDLFVGIVCEAPPNASDSTLLPRSISDAITDEGSFASSIGQAVSPFVRN
jgi:hypothetical protein